MQRCDIICVFCILIPFSNKNSFPSWQLPDVGIEHIQVPGGGGGFALDWLSVL